MAPWNEEPTAAAWTKKCAFEQCNKIVGQKGAKKLCAGHYNQLRSGKQLSILVNKIMEDPAPDGYKTCRDCRQVLALADFFIHQKNKGGMSLYCRECESFHKKFRNHGVTREVFLKMLVEQDYCCAIGGTPISKDSARIDHDHACCPGERSCGNCVRGLLCNSCNGGLGLFRDDTLTLQKAVEYLGRWNDG